MNSNDAGRTPGANHHACPGHKCRGHHHRLTGANGTEVILQFDRQGRKITADATDFDRLCSLGFSGRWFVHGNGHGNEYVRVQCRIGQRGQPTTVARLILDVSSGRNVRYRDGNPLNLCRSNLYLEDGYAKGNTQAVLRQAQPEDLF